MAGMSSGMNSLKHYRSSLRGKSNQSKFSAHIFDHSLALCMVWEHINNDCVPALLHSLGFCLSKSLISGWIKLIKYA